MRFDKSQKSPLDKSLICDTLYLVDNCVWSAGACSRFSFFLDVDPELKRFDSRQISSLESINCEMQFS
jgi:hypothetical protein